jgi:hypothetical protein
MGKISRRKQEVLYTQSMTNAPELLSRLQEVGRCMALPFPSAAHEVRTACRALAHTTEAEGPEIASAGRDLAKAAEGASDSASNLRLHLRLQTLTARIQTAAESSQAGRVWAAAQNLAELLLVVGKFLDEAPEPHWSEEIPPALGLEAVRLEFSNLVSLLGWPTVLLGYSVETEFCASSSEFTTVAVPLALVSPLVLAGVADGRTHR